MLKKIVSLGVVSVMTFGLVACGGFNASTTTSIQTEAVAKTESVKPAENAGGGDAAYNWTIGTSATKDSAIGKTMQHLANEVKEKTGGKVDISCYPDSQLGSDAELAEGVQMGQVTMVIGNTAPQVTFVPDLALFDLPNTYDDIKDAQPVLAGFTEKMAPSFDDASFHLCQIFPTVFRYMSGNKEIKTVDDFKGIKIRTMTNNNHMAFWTALGAEPTPLDFSELYVGLQQGLVDAQENPLDIFLNSKFYEQQKYVIDTKHIVFVADILMNKDIWDSLEPELQNILTDCFKESGEYASKIAQEAEYDNIQKVKDQGVQIIELDDSVINDMREKAQVVYESIRAQVGSDLVDEYLNAIEEQAAK